MDFMRSPLGAQYNENKNRWKAYKQKGSIHKDNPSFKGMPILTNGLFRLLDSNKFVGANTVDIVSMVIPRTYVDSKRNPDAKMETLFRESQSVFVHSTIGVMGFLAALAMKHPLKSKYKINFENINVNSNSIDAFSHAFHKGMEDSKKTYGAIKNEKVIETYLNEIFGNLKGLDGKEWKALDDKTKESVIKELKDLILDKQTKKINKNTREKLVIDILKKVHSKNNIKIDINGSPTIETNLNLVVKDSFTLGKTFLKQEVFETFKKVTKSSESIFVKDLKRFTGGKTVLGLLAASALGFSFQSINRKLTQKRTGQEGFVGYSDFGINTTDNKPKIDKSNGFKALKALAVAGMATLSITSIQGKIKDIPRKIQFTSLMPTLNQIKIVYAATIIGRILASSDKNELRETTTRDYLGFVNWLILGDVISRQVAKHLDKSLVNSNSTMKSHDEIIYSAKELAKKTPKSFIKIVKKLKPETLKKLGVTNIALLTGYVSSGLALGLFIPWLNKTITANRRTKELSTTKNTIQSDSNIHFKNSKIMTEETKLLFSAFVKN